MALNILVCGGAGYIGSHLVKEISKLPHNIIVFDNLSKGALTHRRFNKLIKVPPTN
jgi:UDP-glucose 4-epimerase